MANSAPDPHLLPGVLIGHDTDDRRPTGVTVVLLPEGTTAGVDVRGAAPGTRETDLLDPVNTVQGVHAIALCGGSAFGLDAAGGVMRWLEGQGRGIEVGPVRVPLVPAAVIFDLGVGDPLIRPDSESRRPSLCGGRPGGRGSAGQCRRRRGGVGGQASRPGPRDARRGGHRHAPGAGVHDGRGRGGQRGGRRRGSRHRDPPGGSASVARLAGAGGGCRRASWPGTSDDGSEAAANTTIGVVVTDARLTKTQATRLAQVAHDGLARTIRPVHTPMDGDTLFAAATGTVDPQVQDALPPEQLALLLSVMAAEVTALAVLRAVRAAEGLRLGDLWLPAWQDMHPG